MYFPKEAGQLATNIIDVTGLALLMLEPDN